MPVNAVINQCCTLRQSTFVLPVVVVLLLCVAGCGDNTSVSGRVNLDGEPVRSGSILFLPDQQGRGQGTGGSIKDGEYLLEGKAAPAVGNYRVEIRSSRKTGRMVPPRYSPRGKEIEEIEEAVAEKYNDNSTLSFEIKPGVNEKDWDVESRK